ncbi:MAG: hypothetical protein M3018_07670 [Actinomycetota bacterium]|nr:hypothetical protein [Actinomycetota bacterium]
MGAIEITTTLAERGPAAAVVLDDQQVSEVGEGAKRFPVLRHSQRLHLADVGDADGR